ncbi:hypothetical protein H4582DRAFT_2057841 [Lactarius indigo]|nr:hypothetical protein H4582DRAFT_2057841 [Lactarius indigo]
MSIAVYASGRSNGWSPSPEAKPHLDEATRMIELLALNTPGLCKMLVAHLRVWPGLGLKPVEDMEMKWIMHACGIIWWELTGGWGVVEEPGLGLGNARLGWLSTMGNGRIGSFVDSGVGVMGSKRVQCEGIEARYIGEGRSNGKYVQRQGAVGVVVIHLVRLVCVTTLKAVHGHNSTLEKTGHERQVTTMNPNASHIPLILTYILSVAPWSLPVWDDKQLLAWDGASLAGPQFSPHSMND